MGDIFIGFAIIFVLIGLPLMLLIGGFVGSRKARKIVKNLENLNQK